MDEMTNVSLRGNRAYTKALKALAYSQGIAVGDLVRLAVDAKFGKALKKHIDFFDANTGNNSVQLEVKGDKTPA